VLRFVCQVMRDRRLSVVGDGMVVGGRFGVGGSGSF
jgi:hypothetical protein